MEQEKKSRRKALELIGKTGIFLGTGPSIFLSLNTFSQTYTDPNPELAGEKQRKTTIADEKVVISGSGSELTIKINGKSGRYFCVVVAGSDAVENYRAFPNSIGIINAKGIGSFVINTKEITNSKIFIKVITGETKEFTSGIGVTEPFIINTKGGQIESFEGMVSRPIFDSKSVATVASLGLGSRLNKNNPYQLK